MSPAVDKKLKPRVCGCEAFSYLCGIKTNNYAEIQMPTAGGYRYGKSHHFL